MKQEKKALAQQLDAVTRQKTDTEASLGKTIAELESQKNAMQNTINETKKLYSQMQLEKESVSKELAQCKNSHDMYIAKAKQQEDALNMELKVCKQKQADLEQALLDCNANIKSEQYVVVVIFIDTNWKVQNKRSGKSGCSFDRVIAATRSSCCK